MGYGTSEKKLTFVRGNYTSFGGKERYLERVCAELKKNGIKYEILHLHAPEWLPSWLKTLLFGIQVCANKGNRFYFSLDRISCPDIYRAGDGVHRAYLQTRRFSLNPLHPVLLFLEKRCFENARVIIANSNMVKDQIIRHYHINSEKIRVICNGIPIREPLPNARLHLAKKYKFDKKNRVILFVGSGFKRKGVKELLLILSQLKHNFTAFIVGKEKMLNRYMNLSKKLGIGDKVIFTGLRKDVDLFYSASDLFIFPSHYDPFSNVILEAMNFENVVFTTKQNGASEILSDKFIMSCPTDFSIIPVINRFLTDDNLLRRQKRTNSQIAKNHSIEKNVAETLKCINIVTAGLS